MSDFDDRVWGTICNNSYPLRDLNFAGRHAYITGASSSAMKMLASLLLKMDFTLTVNPAGEPSVTFYEDYEFMNVVDIKCE